MHSTEKKYILTFIPQFEVICKFISSVFSELHQLSRGFAPKSSNINEVLLNQTVIFCLDGAKCFKKLIKGSGFFVNLSNQELNTATVYINGSNHNLAYAASACRLHPGPTLYTQHAFWRTTRAGN